jgi:hypothetical protein
MHTTYVLCYTRAQLTCLLRAITTAPHHSWLQAGFYYFTRVDSTFRVSGAVGNRNRKRAAAALRHTRVVPPRATHTQSTYNGAMTDKGAHRTKQHNIPNPSFFWLHELTTTRYHELTRHHSPHTNIFDSRCFAVTRVRESMKPARDTIRCVLCVVVLTHSPQLQYPVEQLWPALAISIVAKLNG